MPNLLPSVQYISLFPNNILENHFLVLWNKIFEVPLIFTDTYQILNTKHDFFICIFQ